jgi:peptidoglycan/xylan/chitin deacetylase (PgdA/CDA1 family)
MISILRMIRFILFDFSFLLKKDNLYVFMFHKVNDKNEFFYKGMPTETFKKLIFFVEKRFQIIHFKDVDKFKEDSSLKKPLLIITFDDGMSDISENVYSFLEKHQIKYTINVDTNILYTNRPQYFVQIYDILNNVPKFNSYFDSKFMKNEIQINYSNSIETESQFTELLSNMNNSTKEIFIERMVQKLNFDKSNFSGVISKEWIFKNRDNPLIVFGSHSHTHPIFNKLSNQEIINELELSKNILEDLINKPVDVFAYPNGACSKEIDEIIKNKGFKYVLKTEDKLNEYRITSENQCFYRINQYHQNTEVALLHSLGILSFIKKITKFGTKTTY